MACPVRPSRGLVAAVLAACLILASGTPALATNVTNLLGYSSAAQAMGGAASVSVLDTQLINTNPASLTLLPDSTDRPADSSIKAGIANLTLGVLQPYFHHTDVFGTDRAGENQPYLAIQGGLALRFKELPQLTFGLGLFSQSGLGTEFRGFRTAFGTRDELSSYERFVKLQSAISYEIVDGFSVGIGPYIGYSDLTLHFFPRTGAAPVFAGLAIGDQCSRNYGIGEPGSDCPWSVVGGVKIGATWKITPTFTAGVAYTSPADFHYDNGTANVVFTPAGRASRVKYDVSVSGISHPQNVQMGFAYTGISRLLLAMDLTWHDWSAFEHFTIKLRNPDTPGAPSQIDLFNQQSWRDQFVIALGAAYELIPGFFTLRGGYNYANNPIPAQHFNPAIQVPFQHHLSAGAGVTMGKHWEFDAGFIWGFENKITYTNQQLPFGPNATDKPSGYSVGLTAGYRF
ncbi:MAG TPA: outer membrane protein transport protein [Candidatus Binatia bacterium]|nr:outer membrane protein transport protein [Candidatus Binatia bacterium]